MDTKKIAFTAIAVLVGAVSCSGSSAPATDETQQSTVVAVDADGFVIHRFEERPRPVDERGTDPRVDPPPDRQRLACDPGAPAGWEPVSFERNRTLAGVAPDLLGFHRRADGSRQLTVDGCPVYRYVGNGRTPPGAWWPIPATAAAR